MDFFTDALKKYAEFSGRATRQQYWMFVLFYLIFYIVLLVIDAVLGTAVLALLFSLGMLIPSLSCAVRRLHDTGRSGWLMLLSLIPLIGAIVLLIFLCQGSRGDNQYGPAPAGAPPAA